VSVDRVVEPLRQLLDSAFELAVRERRDLTAGLADEVVVVLAARVDRLVARHALGGVDAARQPQPVEQVERAVDRATPTSSPRSCRRSAISFAVTLQPSVASVSTTAERGVLSR
jgi:hypothetical protein